MNKQKMMDVKNDYCLGGNHKRKLRLQFLFSRYFLKASVTMRFLWEYFHCLIAEEGNSVGKRCECLNKAGRNSDLTLSLRSIVK